MYIELIGIMSLVLSALSGVATVYLALQVAIMRKMYMVQYRLSRMERTLEAVQLPPSVTKTIDDVSRSQGAYNFDHQEVANDIFVTLGTLETLATGILAGVYDEEIAYTRLGDSIPNFYKAIQRFIYESRSSNRSASLFVQLEQLARRWQDKDRSSYRATGNYALDKQWADS